MAIGLPLWEGGAIGMAQYGKWRASGKHARHREGISKVAEASMQAPVEAPGWGLAATAKCRPAARGRVIAPFFGIMPGVPGGKDSARRQTPRTPVLCSALAPFSLFPDGVYGVDRHVWAFGKTPKTGIAH